MLHVICVMKLGPHAIGRLRWLDITIADYNLQWEVLASLINRFYFTMVKLVDSTYYLLLTFPQVGLNKNMSKGLNIVTTL